jgi:hypothetical protein
VRDTDKYYKEIETFTPTLRKKEKGRERKKKEKRDREKRAKKNMKIIYTRNGNMSTSKRSLVYFLVFDILLAVRYIFLV